jgi:Membrane protein involved in the export of O-antigen and teichoic acid
MLFKAALAVFMRGLAACAIFAFNFVVAKRLDPVASGYFLWAFSGVVIFLQVGLMGFHDVALKHIARSVGSGKDSEAWSISGLIFSRVLLAFIIVSSLLLLLSEKIAHAIFPESREVVLVVRLMVPGLAFNGMSHLLSFQLQGAGKPAKAIFSLSIGHYALFCAILILSGTHSPVMASAIYSFASLINTLLAFVWWRNAIPSKTRVPVDRRELWSMAMPLWAIALMSVIVNWGGQLISGIWVSAEEISHYAVAMRAVALINFILLAMNFVVAPRIAQLHAAHDIQGLQSFITTVTRFLYSIAIPVAACVILFSDQVMGIFGSEFSRSGRILLVLAVGQIINVLTGPVSHLLTMTGNERSFRNVYVLSSALCLLLTYALTKRLGILGTAVATSLAISLQNGLAAYMVRKKLGISISPFRSTSATDDVR